MSPTFIQLFLPLMLSHWHNMIFAILIDALLIFLWWMSKKWENFLPRRSSQTGLTFGESTPPCKDRLSYQFVHLHLIPQGEERDSMIILDVTCHPSANVTTATLKSWSWQVVEAGWEWKPKLLPDMRGCFESWTIY